MARVVFSEMIDEWRMQYAFRLLTEKRTTLSKAAQIAGMDIWSFIAKIKELKVDWVGGDIIDGDFKEVT